MTSMDRSSELELILRLRAGDPGAFDQVHDAFNSRLYTFLLRLSRRRDVAEDLLEETWLRLVKHARRLRPDTRLAPWLFTVARHLYISYVRSRVLEDSLGGTLMALWPCGMEPPSPFEAAAANELERRIERALTRLSPRSREVLLLVGVAGLDPADAAGVCGIRPDAFRQRLSRARGELERRLAADVSCRVGAIGEVTP
jgi:RNA polymerase sigma-70 factor (ECF subfamily)